MKFSTEDELLEFTKQIKGKRFKEIDKDNVLVKNPKDKGALGKVVESGFYGYANNNKAEADFDNLGIELKVSGYIKNKNGTISAKERIKLSSINFNTVVNEEFNYSKLLFKNKKILIIWYEYDKELFDREQSYENFIITDYQLYDMSGDELVIKNDFEIIKQKVISGEAHLLSEGDTAFLGACTSGTKGANIVKQPYSELPARKRAFSLKNSYITGILRNMDIILKVDNIEYKTIEEYVFAQLNNYIGKSQEQMYKMIFKQNMPKEKIPKNLNKMFSDRIIGKDKELETKDPLFSKTRYEFKNLPVNKYYYPLERMAFRNIKLSEFEDEWEDSAWKTYFEEVTFVVICYEGNKKSKNGERILKGSKIITFTDEDLELFGRTYKMLRNAILKKDTGLLPYPKSFDGQPLEVAPKGGAGAKAYTTFFEKDTTKVCFMLNIGYLFSKLVKDGEENE